MLYHNFVNAFIGVVGDTLSFSQFKHQNTSRCKRGISVLRIHEVLLSYWITCLTQSNITIYANHNLPPANYFLITLRSHLQAQVKGNSEIWCTHLL